MKIAFFALILMYTPIHATEKEIVCVDGQCCERDKSTNTKTTNEEDGTKEKIESTSK